MIMTLWVGLQPDTACHMCSAVISGKSPTHCCRAKARPTGV